MEVEAAVVNIGAQEDPHIPLVPAVPQVADELISCTEMINGRASYIQDARLKWWYIISELKHEFLELVRGDKAKTVKKLKKKDVHVQIAAFMGKDLGDNYSTKYLMQYDQSQSLYLSMKKAHDKYITKPSGSAAGAPPPTMFDGMWDSYTKEMNQVLKLKPVFRADPDAIVRPRDDDAGDNNEGSDIAERSKEGVLESSDEEPDGGAESRKERDIKRRRLNKNLKQALVDRLAADDETEAKRAKTEQARHEEIMGQHRELNRSGERIAASAESFVELLRSRWGA